MTTQRKAPSIHPARLALTFREAFLAGITPADVQEVAKALLKKAKSGDAAAAKILFDRCLGMQQVEHWSTENRVTQMEGLDERFG